MSLTAWRYLMLCFGFMLYGPLCLAQEYTVKIRSVGVEDGLVSSEINGFHFDSQGFTWIGTNQGLSRYDGTRFTNYTVANGALLNDRIRQMVQDFEGNMWIGNYRSMNSEHLGIQVLDVKKGKAQSLQDFLGEPLPFSSTRVALIRSDPWTRELWISTHDKQVFVYYPDEDGKGKLQLVKTFSITTKLIATCPLGVWMQTDEGTYLLNKEGKVIRQLKVTLKETGTNLGADSLGNVYYLRKGLRGPKSNSIISVIYANDAPLDNTPLEFWEGKRPMGFNMHQLQSWYEDAPRKVYDSRQQLLAEFKVEEEIYTWPKLIRFDRFGNGWAVHNNKVFIVKLVRSKFKNYLGDQRIFGSLGYGARGLYVNQNDELFTNGLGPSLKIDLKTGEEQVVDPGSNFYDGPIEMEQLKRYALKADPQGNLWYTDEGPRLFKWNPDSDQYSDYTYSGKTVRDAPIPNNRTQKWLHWTLHFDRNDRLWLGGQRGIRYLHPTDSVLTELQDYEPFPILGKVAVYHFHENDQGIWIASTRGLFLMSLEGKLLKSFAVEGEVGERIPHNNIAHIREDKEGWLWLATKGGGLVKLNPDTGEYEQYTTADGLSHNTTYATYADEFGYMWVPSDKGIMRINLADFSVSTYLKSDGLSQEEFNTTAHFQAGDGRLYFGHLNGVTSFDPKDFVDEGAAEINLRLTQLEKQSRKTGEFQVDNDLFLNERRIVLKPSELGFLVRFSLMDYMDAPSNTYSYKIEGLDQDWVYVNEPEVRISALPYGEYTLVLRGQGAEGRWSRQISIPVEVIRPIYLRWWFFVLLGLVVAAYITYAVRRRTQKLLTRQAHLEEEIDKRTLQVRQQAEELKELDKLKSKFFANVSHELRTPLSLITAPLSKLISSNNLQEKDRKELVRIQKNSQQIGQLVEEILDLARLENNRIEPKYKKVTIDQFCKEIFKTFEPKAQSLDIGFEHHYSGKVHQQLAIDPHMVERIVSNLLTNAFKFTASGGEVRLQVLADQDELEVKVIDNGPGISERDLPHVFDRFFQTKDGSSAASGGTGIGLALSRDLADIMDGNLRAESEEGKGSTFTLVVPDQTAHLTTEALSTDALPEKKVAVANGAITYAPGKRARVLVVEDHEEMREFIAESLADDYHTDQARDGVQALQYLGRTRQAPQVIISDMMMPEMDGLELLGKLREEEAYRQIPVIMLTARSTEEDKLGAFQLGVDDYLVKPFSVEELKARIKNLLKVAESRRIASLTSDVDHELPEQLDDKTEQWLLKVKEITQENVSKVDFNIRSVAEALGLSERQFQRNLKKVSGYSPTVYLKEIRLQMARSYLEKRTFEQVSEVSRAVGFTSTDYFSKMFKARFGRLPSSYFFDE